MVAMSFCVMQPAFGVEPAEARKLVQLCRDLGRDQGITEKRALREYARECVDDVRSVYEDGTLQAHDTTIDELDMVQIDSEIPKFLQYKKQNFQESSLSESAHN